MFRKGLLFLFLLGGICLVATHSRANQRCFKILQKVLGKPPSIALRPLIRPTAGVGIVYDAITTNSLKSIDTLFNTIWHGLHGRKMPKTERQDVELFNKLVSDYADILRSRASLKDLPPLKPVEALALAEAMRANLWPEATPIEVILKRKNPAIEQKLVKVINDLYSGKKLDPYKMGSKLFIALSNNPAWQNKRVGFFIPRVITIVSN